MLLLTITSYTYILLLFSNNRTSFADISVLVHGRNKILKESTSFQNIQSNRTRGDQKNFLPSIIIRNMTGFNILASPELRLKNNSIRFNNSVSTISSQLTEAAAAEAKQKNSSSPKEVGEIVRVAVVEPTFTAAAYNKSFYIFYQKYRDVPANLNITSDLNLLSTKVPANPIFAETTSVHSGFSILAVAKDLKMTSPKSNITVLTDVDLDKASIFKNNNKNNANNNYRNNVQNIINSSSSNAYDVIIIGHQEYVTQQEYNNLKRFVSNGGTLIILDGNVFYAEVKYDTDANRITLVKGHGWAFNGRSAWKSVAERWGRETSQWVGSNYLCYSCKITFANDPFEYRHHEEQYITNPNDKILMNYNASLFKYPTPSLKPVIATYELNYEKGKVITLGIYSDDIIANYKFMRYFNRLFLEYAS